MKSNSEHKSKKIKRPNLINDILRPMFRQEAAENRKEVNRFHRKMEKAEADFVYNWLVRHPDFMTERF